MAVGQDVPDSEVWDDETGETFGQARIRFARLGTEEVSPAVAHALASAGWEVWSFGYGDDPEEFTTVDQDDVENGADVEEFARDWAPFRFDPTLAPTGVPRGAILGMSAVSSGRDSDNPDTTSEEETR